MPGTRMEVVRLESQTACTEVDLKKIPREVTDDERELFARITSVDLTKEQIDQVAVPAQVYPRQDVVLAVHWHPEFVPMEVIMARVDAMFPNRTEELIIPTQHNELLTLNGYAGVEVDCYASGFNRKVQLLLHFTKDKVAEAATLKSMLDHTFTYRRSQLFEFMAALMEPNQDDKRQKAAAATGADAGMVEFACLYTAKLKAILDEKWQATPRTMIKNKLVRNFFDGLRAVYGDRYIGRVQVYAKEVKKLVKDEFSLKYFYRASEVIEEARGLGGCVVIPHPEEFWPILLADYDVDGIEVWNPQSQEYTEFLINVVHRHNKNRRSGDRRMLVFMGDDCHFSEKTRDPAEQDPVKAARQLGLQTAWDDMGIRKSLTIAGMSRRQVITEYKQRLAGGG